MLGYLKIMGCTGTPGMKAPENYTFVDIHYKTIYVVSQHLTKYCMLLGYLYKYANTLHKICKTFTANIIQLVQLQEIKYPKSMFQPLIELRAMVYFITYLV